MREYSSIFDRLISMVVLAIDWFDRSLPGRYRGRIAKKFAPKSGKYILPRFKDRASFYEAARALGLRFVTLAGVDESTSKNGTETMTLMVCDEDVSLARKLVTPWPVGEAVEVYSPSGLPGFAFGDMPILPPRLANRLLESYGVGRTDANAYRMLPPKERFFFGLFRDVYLKGLNSGIGSQHHAALSSERRAKIDSVISAARSLGMNLEQPVTLESLDRLLDANGWRPPVEILERIGCWNDWVADTLRREGQWIGAEPPGLSVFYLRQRAVDLGQTDRVLSVLSKSGFEILPLPQLSDEQMTEVTHEIRGGNWGKGPFPKSGGEPKLVVIAFDPTPKQPPADVLSQFPLLDNERIQIAKQSVRAVVQAGVQRSQRYNAMHSTDNSVQALRAVRAVRPDLEEHFRERLKQISFSARQADNQ